MPQPRFQLLKDQVAIVSGAGPGLGRSTAMAMVRQGARVVLGARTQSRIEEYAREIEGMGGEALAVPIDTTKAGDPERIATAAMERFGKIDVLVNVAGGLGAFGPLIDAPIDEWRRTVETNAVGTMAMCHAVAPHMVEAGSGAIVNVLSIAMRQGGENRSAYASSKAAILLMTQSMAAELGRDGIRANCVVPGAMWSDRVETFYRKRAEEQGKSFEEVHAAMTAANALGRIATADEVAPAIVFMASSWASTVTGQSLDVNSGQFFY